MKKLHNIIILVTLILLSFGCNREYAVTDTEPIDDQIRDVAESLQSSLHTHYQTDMQQSSQRITDVQSQMPFIADSIDNNNSNNASEVIAIQGEDNTALNGVDFTFRMEPVDVSRIVYCEDPMLPDYLFEYYPGIPQDCYAITGSQTYDDWEWMWIRSYAVYYPRFTAESSYYGMNVIMRYYADRAEAEAASFALHWPDYLDIAERDALLFTATDSHLYDYQTYNIGYNEPFVSVVFSGEFYSGGAHGLYCHYAECFDMRTGELLRIEDLFGDEDAYRPELIQLVYNTAKNDLLHLREPISVISDAMDYMSFHITESGIEFIFQPHTLGGSWPRNFTVPYVELQGILNPLFFPNDYAAHTNVPLLERISRMQYEQVKLSSSMKTTNHFPVAF